MISAQLFLASGSYTVGGGHIDLFFRGQYTVTQEINATIINVGTPGQEGEPVEVNIRRNGVLQEIPNVEIAAILNNRPMDLAYTSASGTAYVFLQSGTYDLEMHGSMFNRTYHNYTISSGIQPFYSYVSNGNAVANYGDVSAFPTNSSLVYQISGQVVSEENVPIENAEILITQGAQVIVDYFTDCDGRYNFLLNSGTYDIRLRASDKTLKIHRNFNFVPANGFLQTLSQLDVSFQLGGDGTWIFN